MLRPAKPKFTKQKITWEKVIFVGTFTGWICLLFDPVIIFSTVTNKRLHYYEIFTRLRQ